MNTKTERVYTPGENGKPTEVVVTAKAKLYEMSVPALISAYEKGDISSMEMYESIKYKADLTKQHQDLVERVQQAPKDDTRAADDLKSFTQHYKETIGMDVYLCQSLGYYFAIQAGMCFRLEMTLKVKPLE